METLVRLKGKTLKGKNRVREHGKVWRVLQVADGNFAFVKKGEILIEPAEKEWPPALRWIDPYSDEHFTVEYI